MQGSAWGQAGWEGALVESDSSKPLTVGGLTTLLVIL